MPSRRRKNCSSFCLKAKKSSDIATRWAFLTNTVHDSHLVFNKPFKPSGSLPSINSFSFSELSGTDSLKLKGNKNIPEKIMSKIHYLYFPVSCSNADFFMIGRTCRFLNSQGLAFPVSPESFLDYLKSVFLTKNSIPPNFDDFQIALADKGVDREFVNKALKEYLPTGEGKREEICHYIDRIGNLVLDPSLIGKVKSRALKLQEEIYKNEMLNAIEQEAEKKIASLSMPVSALILNPGRCFTSQNNISLDDVDHLSLVFIASFHLQEAKP
jgi:hypothetical protein